MRSRECASTSFSASSFSEASFGKFSRSGEHGHWRATNVNFCFLA